MSRAGSAFVGIPPEIMWAVAETVQRVEVDVVEFEEVDPESLIPLETKLLRADHSSMMVEVQGTMAREYRQSDVEHFSLKLGPIIKKEQQWLTKAYKSEEYLSKLKELEAHTAALKEAYEAAVAAQEKLIESLRERVPPEEEEEEEEGEKNDEEKEDKEEGSENQLNSSLNGSFRKLAAAVDGAAHSIVSGVTHPSDQTKKTQQQRPGWGWGIQVQESVRGLFGGPKPPVKDVEMDDSNSIASGVTHEFVSPIPENNNSNSKRLGRRTIDFQTAPPLAEGDEEDASTSALKAELAEMQAKLAAAHASTQGEGVLFKFKPHMAPYLMIIPFLLLLPICRCAIFDSD